MADAGIRPWVNVEIRPCAAPRIEHPIDGSYLLEWEEVGLAVILSANELADLMAECMIAQARATIGYTGPQGAGGSCQAARKAH